MSFLRSTPAKPAAESIPSAQHWQTYKTRAAEFVEQKIVTSDDSDEKCFAKLHETFVTCLAIGSASETKNLLAKKQASNEAAEITKKAFGEEQILPVAGAKSLAYLRHVYLPYYQDSQRVQINGNALEKLVIAVFANSKREEYRVKAERLSATIADFSGKNPEFEKSASDVLEKMALVKAVDTGLKK